MKGLILKDLYMAAKYCRSYALITLVFLVLSGMEPDNTFFVFYPCLLCGMIPVNLLAYDERSKWLLYSATLPYSRAQIVSGKYLIGLMAQLVILIATGIVQALRMHMAGGADLGALALILGSVLLMAAFASSIAMPFMFRWGVEKGRIAYYVMVGLVTAGAVIVRDFPAKLLSAMPSAPTLAPLLCLAASGLYAISWYLSIKGYEKREL